MKKTTLTIILTSILAFSVSFGQERPRLVKLIVAKAIKEKVSSGDIVRKDRPELSDEAKDQLSELKGKKDALRAELKENISKLGEGATKEEVMETLSIATLIGGTIVVPHLRRAYEFWEELEVMDNK